MCAARLICASSRQVNINSAAPAAHLRITRLLKRTFSLFKEEADLFKRRRTLSKRSRTSSKGSLDLFEEEKVLSITQERAKRN